MTDTALPPIASAVSSDPTLHFIVYVPAQSKQPLLLRRVDGIVEQLSFFSLPQWGGVAIQPHTSSDINEAAGSAGVLSKEDLKSAFTTFAGQLEAFHGLSSMPEVMGVDAVQRDWKVQALMRERVVENVLDATQKLGALSRQVREIQNMRIPRAVQDDVQGALKALDLVSREPRRPSIQYLASSCYVSPTDFRNFLRSGC
jgi:phosphatidylinositol glycan class S